METTSNVKKKKLTNEMPTIAEQDYMEILDTWRPDRKKDYDPEEAANYSYLPQPEGEMKVWAVSLTKDAPRKAMTLMGITFSKQKTTPKTEKDPTTEPVFDLCRLDEKQVKAIKKKAESKMLYWREEERDEDGRVYYLKCEAPASEFLSIIEYPFIDGEWKIQEPMQEVAQQSAIMYSEQAKSSVKEYQDRIAELEDEAERQRQRAEEAEKKQKKEEAEDKLGKGKNNKKGK